MVIMLQTQASKHKSTILLFWLLIRILQFHQTLKKKLKQLKSVITKLYRTLMSNQDSHMIALEEKLNLTMNLR